MLRYYWTLIVATLVMLFIGFPVITLGHVLRRFFGIEGLIFPCAKFGCRIWLRSAGARVHVSGREHLDPQQGYLFAANHQSNLDPPLLFAYLGPNTGALAKQELTKFPLFKQGFDLKECNITFNPENITLNTLNAAIGKSDIQASGTLDNWSV